MMTAKMMRNAIQHLVSAAEKRGILLVKAPAWQTWRAQKQWPVQRSP